MADLIYYVAMSVDGFIADRNGGVGWLEQIPPSPSESDYGYGRLLTNTDALIMGRATYEQILGFGDWPYAGKLTWVMTSRPLVSQHDDVIITHQSPADVIADIRGRGLGQIWLVGGGILAKAFHDESLIDEYMISVIPQLLGEGIPLFAVGAQETPMLLTHAETYDSGVVQMTYRKRRIVVNTE